ncbi:S9 family peptidase [Kibdelosporangium philippinense]|uniref:S9 family peptidase n=1 Tax=Kibdelosporangium philippinense TaxID=211113 RepID=A0ABS8Z827_9PSEU|nr:prolyl oligopeptidase family serine peptidase [Kibdelosporangium philippinense]MCE7004019.1 S9 family peptidase [Kibdelosporangium philippinense]
MPDLSYDVTAPLNLTLDRISERAGVTISRCEFDNAEGDRVVGYLVEPAGTPRAGVVYIHTTSFKEGFLPEAIQFAEAGGIALCLGFHYIDDQVASIRQTVQSIRRGADLLLRRTDAIAVVGHSGGALMTSVVAGIDHRFRCFVLEVPMAGLTHHWRNTSHPNIVRMRAGLPPELFESTLEAMAPYDAEHFIGDAQAPLLFQFARFDIGVTVAESEEFYAMAPEPKEQHWYDSGHVINDVAAYADRARFLAKHLDLPGLPDALARRLQA